MQMRVGFAKNFARMVSVQDGSRRVITDPIYRFPNLTAKRWHAAASRRIDTSTNSLVRFERRDARARIQSFAVRFGNR